MTQSALIEEAWSNPFNSHWLKGKNIMTKFGKFAFPSDNQSEISVQTDSNLSSTGLGVQMIWPIESFRAAAGQPDLSLVD